jgi:hypothetical protein
VYVDRTRAVLDLEARVIPGVPTDWGGTVDAGFADAAYRWAWSDVRVAGTALDGVIVGVSAVDLGSGPAAAALVSAPTRGKAPAWPTDVRVDLDADAIAGVLATR